MSSVSKVIREQVQRRANGRCEYCLKPEGVSQYSHHIDHIIATRHGGSSNLDNLAWACFQCNSAKTSDIASYDWETNALTPLYNPRTQNWTDNFELDGALVVGRTPIGRVTVHVLQMNEPEQVEVRSLLMQTNRW